MPSKKVIKGWGGFVDDKLDLLPPSSITYRNYGEPRYAVFKTKKGAKRAYRDVRRVEIHIMRKLP